MIYILPGHMIIRLTSDWSTTAIPTMVWPEAIGHPIIAIHVYVYSAICLLGVYFERMSLFWGRELCTMMMMMIMMIMMKRIHWRQWTEHWDKNP